MPKKWNGPFTAETLKEDSDRPATSNLLAVIFRNDQRCQKMVAGTEPKLTHLLARIAELIAYKAFVSAH